MTSNASSSREMAKAYSPKEVEARLYAFWEERGWFAPSANNGKEPFCIIMPPPNVTGELHLGHALVATISDALVRWHRMRGEPTLWLPGEDHASIAAQWVMEQELAKQGQTRQELGREGFLERMWEWMDKYRHIIMDQHKMLGASCDWSRERFTMDPGPTKAVLTSFVSYYDQGLVYRGNRIINWCPRCGTALSDLEVDHEEDAGALYYVRYPVLPEGARTGPDYVTVATTRPETIPGDVAVAVNPDDPRFKGLIGATVELPLIGRRIPVVADAAVDTAFGTGALKITPGHDPVDFEVGLRHQLPIIVAMDLDAHMNAEAGPYDGLERGEARKAILRDLEAQGLLDHIDPSYAACRGALLPLPHRGGAHRQRAVVPQGAGYGGEGYPGGGDRRHYHRAGAVREGVLPVVGEHPGLVHQPPALVGTPDPRVVLHRLRWRCYRVALWRRCTGRSGH